MTLNRKVARKIYLGIAAPIALVIIGFVLWLSNAPTTVRHLHVGGEAHAIPLPAPVWTNHVGATKASFYVLGDRDLGALFQQKAPAHGWRYGEQLGSMHQLHKPGYVARISRQQRGASFIVLLEVEVAVSAP